MVAARPTHSGRALTRPPRVIVHRSASHSIGGPFPGGDPGGRSPRCPVGQDRTVAAILAATVPGEPT